MSADSKYREDYVYLFFLLLVKELVQLKRCKMTYLRQARKLTNLSKDDVMNTNKIDLPRYNRSFEVFKNMRGTSMYYQDAKKNLMAVLRQNGCPSLFLTVSSAEYKWKELVKQILETEWKQEVSMKYVESLSESERNKIISRSAVQSTVHFQKRIEKLFNLLKYNDIFDGYTVPDFFYRIEFQARGAPHLHALLWLQDSNGEAAPTFWSTSSIKDSKLPDDLKECLAEHLYENNQEEEDYTEHELEKKKKVISDLAKNLIFGSIDDAKCNKHMKLNSKDGLPKCNDCQKIKERVLAYNQHRCTFTCHKKKKKIIIKEDEGHGKLDQRMTGPKIDSYLLCRFNFPLFPLDETIFVQGISKDDSDEDVKIWKKNLLKIKKYMIRQTVSDESWNLFKNFTFIEFLREVGMFDIDKNLAEYDDIEIEQAKKKYILALSASIKGTGKVFLKRSPKDIFTNNFNPNLMLIHEANHDVQMVVDQFACAQYICGYLTKNEAGMSNLLKNINDNAENLSQMELLNKLATVLDKHREVSIQEATYRMLGMPMTKSSVKVKYISTCHPNFRDGLLKGNLDKLDDKESLFHNSVHTYYESRPYFLIYDPNKDYHEDELKPEYWINLSLAEFWSRYDVVYSKSKNLDKERYTIKLENGKGFIRRRKRLAVLRYFLNYENTEDFCRGLLILFLPFRDELTELHQCNVKLMVLNSQNWQIIERNRNMFEAHKVMTDIIKDIQRLHEEDQIEIGDNDDEEEDIDNDGNYFEETTREDEIFDFEKWAKKQANKQLDNVKQYTNLQDTLLLRKTISNLNSQQSKIFHDVIEREVCRNDEKEPYFLFIAGEAGTGKSFLMRVLMEGIKHVNARAGRELNKPTIIAMAPTANAAFIVGAKTIDSALCFSRSKNYTKLNGAKEANLKFLYEDVTTLFCDEISMVGSSKLTKINYRMQDLADGKDKYKFMGGRSFIATGDMWQLPPVKDKYIFEKNHLDGRPSCCPSHWDSNFVIYYMTEKMRSMKDPKFGEVCDRVGKGCILPEDEIYLKNLIRPSPKEEVNDSFKYGNVSIIVTTNKKREQINESKLDILLPNCQSFFLQLKRSINKSVKSARITIKLELHRNWESL